MKNIALALVSIAMALVLADLLFLWSGHSPKFAEIDLGDPKMSFQLSENPILGYEYRPGFNSTNPNLINSFESINEYGLRDRRYQLQKSKKRVILVGDSITMGFGIKQSEMLTREIERNLGDEVEVMNFGVIGYNTRAEVELFKQKGIQFKPDLVVFNYCENDWEDAAGNISGDHRYIYKRPALAKFLFRWSSVYRFLAVQNNWYKLGSYQKDKKSGENKIFLLNNKAMGENSLQQALRLLSELRQKHQLRLVFSLWPHFDTDQIFHRNDYHSSQVKAGQKLFIEELLSQYQIESVRLAPLFLNALKSQKITNFKEELTVVADGMHPNEKGTKMAGKIFAEIIKSRLY